MPESEKITDAEKNDAIEEMRLRLKETDKLKHLRADDEHLTRFLYGTNFDVEAAFNKMKDYYELVIVYPDWFTREGPLNKKSIIDRDVRIMIPQCDKEGRIIYIGKLGNLDLDTMKLLDIVAIDDIWIESVLANNSQITQKGLCIIVDVENYSWKMLKWVAPENIKLSIKKLLGLPFKDIKFHFVNKSMVIHTAIKIMWPFLPASVKEMMKFHFDDWDSLYQHIDKSSLPPEYGGTYNVQYTQLYQKLYERNNEIITIFKLYRDIPLD